MNDDELLQHLLDSPLDTSAPSQEDLSPPDAVEEEDDEVATTAPQDDLMQFLIDRPMQDQYGTYFGESPDGETSPEEPDRGWFNGNTGELTQLEKDQAKHLEDTNVVGRTVDRLGAGGRDVAQRYALGNADAGLRAAEDQDRRAAEDAAILERLVQEENDPNVPYNPWAAQMKRDIPLRIQNRARIAGEARSGAQDSLAFAAKMEEANKLYIGSPVAKAAMESKNLSDMFDAMKIDPVSFIAEIGTRSFPQMVEMLALSMAGGIAGAGVKTVALLGGTGSATAAYASDVLNEVKKAAGGDLSDEDAVTKVLTDETVMGKIKSDGAKYAAVVGVADAVSMGYASKTMFGNTVKQAVTNTVGAKTGVAAAGVTRLGEQMVLQAGSGMVGEAGGSLAAGRDINPVEVVAEGLGELITGPSDTFMATRAGVREIKQQKMDKLFDEFMSANKDEMTALRQNPEELDRRWADFRKNRDASQDDVTDTSEPEVQDGSVDFTANNEAIREAAAEQPAGTDTQTMAEQMRAQEDAQLDPEATAETPAPDAVEEDPLSDDNIVDAELDLMNKSDEEIREEYEREQAEERAAIEKDIAESKAEAAKNYDEPAADIDAMYATEAAEDGGLSTDEELLMEAELRFQAEARRAADNYAFDDELESDQFIGELAKEATSPKPHSTTVESQKSEPSSRGKKSEKSTAQPKQDNDGNTVARDGQQGEQGDNPNVGQQEDPTVAASERQPVSENSNEAGNVEQARTENEAEVSTTPETAAVADADAAIKTDSEQKPAAAATETASKPKAKPKAKSLTVKGQRRQDALRKYLDKTTTKTKGRVQHFPSFEESTLSDDQKSVLRERAEQNKATPAYYDYDDNKIYLFTDQIKSTTEARGLVAHEVFHAGLVDLFGTEQGIQQTLEKMFENHPDMEGLLTKIAQESGFNPALYAEPADIIGERGTIKLSLFMEEAIAHMREHQESAPILKKLFTDVIRRLRELGYTIRNRETYTAEEALLRLVKDAEKAFYSERQRENSKRERDVGKPRHKTLANRYSTRPDIEKIDFYSKLYDAAVNLKQKKGSPQQMLAMLKKQPGVKAEEVMWTGLDNWMELQGKSVTKDAIIEYLYANGVKIETHIATQWRGESYHVFDWNREVLTDSEHYESRLEDMMYEYDSGHDEGFIFNIEEANIEYYTDNPEEVMELFRENISADPQILKVLDYLRRQNNGDTQQELFEESLIEEAMEKATERLHGMDLDSLREFAEALENKDVEEQLQILDVEIDRDKYRDDYEKAAEKVAEEEYMENPIIQFYDSESEITITGNDDVGWTYWGPNIREDTHYGDEEDAKDDAEEAYRQEVGDYVSDDQETAFHEHVVSGDYTRYDEVKVTLPDIDPAYAGPSHFDESNIVAFYLRTDRSVEIEMPSGKVSSVRPYFIEEVQSDWHQHGRKYGYMGKDYDMTRKQKLASLEASHRQRIMNMAKYYGEIFQQENAFKADAPEDRVRVVIATFEGMVTRPEGLNSLDRLRSLTNLLSQVTSDKTFERWVKTHYRFIPYLDNLEKLKKGGKAVADAPYKGTAWMELAVKKAIGEAIQEGNPYIAWPNSQKVFEHWNNKSAMPLYEMVYDNQLPKIIGKLVGNKPTLTAAGHWIVEINQAKVAEYAAKGLPKFAVRQSGPKMTNIETITRKRFERSGLRGYYDNLKRKYAEQYEVMKRVNQHVKSIGGRVDDSTDTYRALKRIPGRTMHKMKELEVDYIKPIQQIIKENKLQADEVGLYLYALHAGERNDFYRDRYDLPMTEYPSGMTEQEANDIIAEYENAGKGDAMRDAAALVQGMREQMLERAKDSGLMHEYVANEYNARYTNFVPLKGFSVTTDANGNVVAPEEMRKPLFTKGMSITGKEFRRALGRQSKAFDPLSTLISDSMEMLVRSENNEAMQHFLRFAQANQDPNQWQIFTNKRPDSTRKWVKKKDPVTGLDVESVVRVNMTPKEMADNYVGVKYRGNQYYIKVADKRLENMMLNGETQKLGTIMTVAKKFNRWLAYVYTSLSPAFAVMNFAKDMPTAYLKIKAEQSMSDGVMVGKDVAGDVMKSVLDPRGENAMGSMKRLLKGLPPRPGNQMDLDAKEMQENGGLVGYYAVKNPETYRKELETFVQRSGKPQSYLWDSRDYIVEVVDTSNKIVENAVRLSAYHHARKGPNPVSIKKAADYARELTVDFNARGTHTTGVGALFLFFNPAIQGTRQFKRTLLELDKQSPTFYGKLNDAHKIMAAATAFNFGWSMTMRALMGKDDDGEDLWDKIPAYHKERSLVFPKLWTDDPNDYYAWPLPYGFSAVTALGSATEMMLSSAMKGQKAEGMAQASKFMISSVLGSFSPVAVDSPENVDEMLIKTLIPEIGKPLVELMLNKNHFGSTIYNEQSPYGTQYADSYEGRLNTGDGYKALASFLNENTGGTSMTSGVIDVHPETLRYWLKYMTGGMGTLVVDQIANPIISGWDGAPYNWENVPIFAGMTSSVKGYEDINNFYKRSNLVLQVLDNKLNAEANNDKRELAKLKKKYGDINQLVGLSTAYRKQMSSLRKQRNAVREDDNLDGGAKHQKTKELDEQIGYLADLFNKEYLALMRDR